MAAPYEISCHDALEFLEIQKGTNRRLIVSSPPYNIRKSYEEKLIIEDYIEWQRHIIFAMADVLAPEGSLCYQVGNYVSNGLVTPLDIYLHHLFVEAGFILRNRIIWRFGHGFHCRKRFSGRHEVVMWYTKSDDYHFDLDAVRVPQKYPSKLSYKGPKKGEYSSNPKGKNPEDVWDFDQDVWNIPNVKAGHIEKTAHPCQFPVGLAERLVLAMSRPGDTIVDPFCGVGSAGVAALIHGRKFLGNDLSEEYCKIARERCSQVIEGTIRFRPHTLPVYDHRLSPLSKAPLIPVGSENPLDQKTS